MKEKTKLSVLVFIVDYNLNCRIYATENLQQVSRCVEFVGWIEPWRIYEQSTRGEFAAKGRGGLDFNNRLPRVHVSGIQCL